MIIYCRYFCSCKAVDKNSLVTTLWIFLVCVEINSPEFRHHKITCYHFNFKLQICVIEDGKAANETYSNLPKLQIVGIIN
jgi:hypothetical protein